MDFWVLVIKAVLLGSLFQFNGTNWHICERVADRCLWYRKLHGSPASLWTFWVSREARAESTGTCGGMVWGFFAPLLSHASRQLQRSMRIDLACQRSTTSHLRSLKTCSAVETAPVRAALSLAVFNMVHYVSITTEKMLPCEQWVVIFVPEALFKWLLLYMKVYFVTRLNDFFVYHLLVSHSGRGDTHTFVRGWILF